jgi:uncharacterized membrane protein
MAFVWRRRGGLRWLPSGAETQAQANSINDHGDIVGTAGSTPMLWLANGRIVHPHSEETGCPEPYEPMVVNNARMIAGQLSSDCDTGTLIVIWQDGVSQVPDVAAIGFNAAIGGLDQRGDLVGESGGGGIFEHPHQAFRYGGGQVAWLSDLGGLSSYARAVTGDGHLIVGDATTSAGVDHAVEWDDQGTLVRDLTPRLRHGLSAFATAVNADGLVAGLIERPSGGTAVVWRNGVRHRLVDLIPNLHGWSNPLVTSINDNGMMAGQAERHGITHAVVFVPTG